MVAPYDALNNSGKDFVSNTLKSASALAEGLHTIANQAAEYSRKSIEDGSALIEKLASTKSPEQAFEAQSRFSRIAYESFVAQAAKFSELYADLAREAYRPYELAVAKVAK